MGNIYHSEHRGEGPEHQEPQRTPVLSVAQEMKYRTAQADAVYAGTPQQTRLQWLRAQGIEPKEWK